jgi:hypothetical protein
MTADAHLTGQLDAMHDPGTVAAGSGAAQQQQQQEQASAAGEDGPLLKRARPDDAPGAAPQQPPGTHALPQDPGAQPVDQHQPQPPQQDLDHKAQEQAQQQQGGPPPGGGDAGGSPLNDLPEGEGEGDDEEDGAAGAGRPRQQGARDFRLRQRRWWGLRRRFADLTAQIEAGICEVRTVVGGPDCEGGSAYQAIAPTARLAAPQQAGSGAGAAARCSDTSPRPSPREPWQCHPPRHRHRARLVPSQAKALIAWRTLPRAPRPVPLSAQDREVLAVQHNRRLFDCASKACLAVIKTMMVQKVKRRGGEVP